MKKCGSILTILALLSTSRLPAQTAEEETPAPPPKTVKSEEWQNWTFAAISLVTAAAGIFFLAIDNGQSAPATP